MSDSAVDELARAWSEADVEGERPFGELVATSLPEPALVIVERNGKKKPATTRTSFVLSPGKYTVTITPTGKPSCAREINIEAYKTHAVDCR